MGMTVVEAYKERGIFGKLKAQFSRVSCKMLM